MPGDTAEREKPKTGRTRGSDRGFFVAFGVMAGTYAVLIVLMLAADILYLGVSGSAVDAGRGLSILNAFTHVLRSPEIRSAIWLTIVSCTLTAILSVFVAVPSGYLLARYRFPGSRFVDAVLDIPIILPPLVVGLSLLILFQFLPRGVREAVVYERPGVVLAQFVVACAFAVRTMRVAFDQIDARREQVALTLGCSRWQAFMTVVLPEARPGVLTAGTLAWARALGEFGPLLIFAGATRNKTEVLSTTVFLELSIGDLMAAVTVSLIMVVGAVAVVIATRAWGTRAPSM